MDHKKPGSILLLSIIILAALVVLAQQLIQNVYVGTRFDKTMIDREKAEVVALGGISVAMALLNEHLMPKTKSLRETAAPAQKNAAADQKKQISKLVSLLNQWRTFELKQEFDGIDGKLSLCITSEEGKINVARVYDFANNKIKPPFDLLLKKVTLGDKNGPTKKETNLADALINFFKERKKGLDDVSELLYISSLTTWPLWYEPHPPQPKVSKLDSKAPELPKALYDLFTLHGTHDKIHPLLMTDAVCALLGVGRITAEAYSKRVARLKPFCDKYQDTWGSDWPANWKSLQLLHPQQPKGLEQFKDIFATKFEPRVYSVVSSGVVNGVEQRLCAIIALQSKTELQEVSARTPTASDTSKPEASKRQPPFKVLKIYWI